MKDKDRGLLLFILSIVLGWIGVDRFAKGDVLLGILKVVTLGGLGVWWLIDIVIFGVRWGMTPADERPAAAVSEPVRPVFEVPSDRGRPGVPSTSRREHITPAPRGTPVEPWVDASRTVEVAGEHYRQQSYDRLFQGLPRTGEWVNLDLDADLYPDPENPYSLEHSAISVWIQGLHAGFLQDGTSQRYSPMLRDLAETAGQYLRVPARVSGVYQPGRSRWHIITRLGLPEPESVLPRNQLPEGQIDIIPTGRVVQVTGEELHMDVLRHLVDPARPAHYAATLRVIHEIRPRSAYETVEIQINGERVGALSKAMGEQIAPLIALIERAGRVPVARATVEGNDLRAEVKLRMIRAAEADHAWIRELRSASPAQTAPTNPAGQKFEWDDEGKGSADAR